MIKMLNKNKWRVLCFAIACILFISGCSINGGKASVVSDSVIKEDLFSSLTRGIEEPLSDSDYGAYVTKLWSDYEYEYSDFSIEKRQTSTEDKTDVVYVSASLSSTNNVIKYTGRYVLSYSLYNDGWLLDKVSVDEFSYFPLQPADFSTEEIKELLEKSWEAKEIRDIIITNQKDEPKERLSSYYVTATRENTYVTTKENVILQFSFTEVGWDISDCCIIENEKPTYNWHISGEFPDPFYGGSILINVSGSINTISVSDKGPSFFINGVDYTRTEGRICSHIYDVKNTSLKELMSNFLSTFGSRSDLEYITYYNFGVVLQGDCTNYDEFKYAILLDDGSAADLLLIGKEKIAISYPPIFEIDKYNKRVVLITKELKPSK